MSWLCLRSLFPKDLRKLVLAKLEPWDMALVRLAHMPQSATAVFSAQTFHIWCVMKGYLGLLQRSKHHVAQRMEICAIAARYGHLHVLQWLVRMGCPLMYPLYSDAAAGGNVEMLEWLKTRGHQQADQYRGPCDVAVGYGHLPALQWLDKNGFYMKDRLPGIAILHGHLHVLQWLVDAKGYSLHPDNALAAVRGGHLHILQWLHGQGQMSPGVCAMAVEQGRLDVLRWLVENGYPIDIDECMASNAYELQLDERERRLEIMAYLESLRAH